MLLHKRLFSTTKDAQEHEASIGQSMFGQRISEWASVAKMDNAQLQQYVRKSWKLKPADITDKIKEFVGFILTPALNVHVTSINCRMQSMFSQFAAAMDQNELSVSCLPFKKQ